MLAEQRDIGGIDHLRVFDPPAPISGIVGGHFVDRIEDFGIGRVTDGVDRDLEIVERGAAHQVAQLRAVEQRQPAITGIVGVILFQQRPA